MLQSHVVGWHKIAQREPGCIRLDVRGYEADFPLASLEKKKMNPDIFRYAMEESWSKV